MPAAVTGTPDNSCIEREVELNDSGSVNEYEISLNFDDGFDIDEAGPGGLWALIVDTSVKRYHDEGLDFGEEDEGLDFGEEDDDLKLGVWKTEAKNNTDDGLKMVESGTGNLSALLAKLKSKDDGGKGAVFMQKDEGNFTVTVNKSRTAGNDDDGKTWTWKCCKKVVAKAICGSLMGDQRWYRHRERQRERRVAFRHSGSREHQRLGAAPARAALFRFPCRRRSQYLRSGALTSAA